MPITSAADLAIVRRAYARQIMAASGMVYERVSDAFAVVRREDFLGPGPWPIVRYGKGHVLTPNDDPVYLYADVLVGIDPQRGLKSGQPSLHFLLMARLDPEPGQHVVHIGAGTGYYSAILAQLVGPAGRITAIECDAGLAARAAASLRSLPWVSLVHGDGVSAAFDPADRIYVNAGVTRPDRELAGSAERWRSNDPAADRRAAAPPLGSGQGAARRRGLPDRPAGRALQRPVDLAGRDFLPARTRATGQPPRRSRARSRRAASSACVGCSAAPRCRRRTSGCAAQTGA